MSESFAVKSRVLRDANDGALSSRFGHQRDMISKRYFKSREEKTYLEMPKHVVKLQKNSYVQSKYL